MVIVISLFAIVALAAADSAILQCPAFGVSCGASPDVTFGLLLMPKTPDAKRVHLMCQKDCTNMVYVAKVDPTFADIATATNKFTVTSTAAFTFFSEESFTAPSTFNSNAGLFAAAAISTVTVAPSPVTTTLTSATPTKLSILIDCGSLMGTASGMVNVKVGTTDNMFTCSSALTGAGPPAAVDGLARLEAVPTDVVTFTFPATLAILAGGAAPAQRTEFAAAFPIAAGARHREAATAADPDCAAGVASPCTIKLGSIQHLVMGAAPPPPPPPPCAITCTTLFDGTCSSPTLSVASTADATCMSGTKVVVADTCSTDHKAHIECQGTIAAAIAGATTPAAQEQLTQDLIVFMAVAIAGGAASTDAAIAQLIAAGLGATRAKGICKAACKVGKVKGSGGNYIVGACISGCVRQNNARQTLWTPIILCPQTTAAEQKACYAAAILNGDLSPTDTCPIVGQGSVSCSTLVPVVPATGGGGSKKGLLGLLGLLGIIPIALLLLCLICLCLICMKRRKRAAYVPPPLPMAPMLTEPCVPHCVAVDPHVTHGMPMGLTY